MPTTQQQQQKQLIKKLSRTSPAVQWLRLPTSTAGGVSSNPGRGIKIPHVAQHSQKKKLSKALNRHFSKENIQMANKHMKRCSVSLTIKVMLIKTTVRYHFTPIREIIIKNKNRK